MLSPVAICMTHAINHALFQARMRFAAEQRWDMRKWSKEAKITIQCKLFKGWKCRVSDQVRKVYKEHLANSVMCVFKYLQATWVKSTQEATEYSAQWGEQSLDARHSVRPNAGRKKKTKKQHFLIYMPALQWHLLIAGCLAVNQSFVKRRWHFTMTFKSDVQRWKTAGATLIGRWRETWEIQPGLGEREKPEDPGYLLLLAVRRTKGRAPHFSFFCLIANNEGIWI